LGRIDHQVKIRGHRIELGEIESQLIKHEHISEVVVIPLEDHLKNDFLCAYLVSDCELPVSELRAFLTVYLPDYMIPSMFILMDELSLTTNGKVDRKKLPQPAVKKLSEVAYDAPENDMELKLAEIWQDVLGIEQIGVNDNFFELGGHSLKATIIMSRVYKELQVQVQLREFFSKQTIRELALHVKELNKTNYLTIQPVEPRDCYPMSSAQKRLYILEQMEDIKTSYNIPAAMIVESEIDPGRFEAAIRTLIERHEAFRTGFTFVDTQPVQVIHPTVDFDISYLNCGDCGNDSIDRVVADFIRPFDLGKPPLLRAGLGDLGDGKHLVLFDMHHIISDGTSLGVIMSEFLTAYEGRMLPELKIQYKDFAVWQNNLLESDIMRKQEEYWLNRFSDELSVLNMPTDYARPALQSFEGGSISFEIDEELTASLNNLANRTGTTLYMVLLSAFQVLLYKYTGQEDIIVGSPIAGRNHNDLQNIVGMFVNTLAMRGYPQGDKTFLSFLQEIKEISLQAYENQEYQFEELVEKLNLQRNFSRNPLFDVSFVLQNADKGLSSAALKAYLHKFENITAKFDIWLCAVEMENNLNFIIEYCSRLYRRDTMERFSREFVYILRQVVADTIMTLDDIRLVKDEEAHRFMFGYDGILADHPVDKTIHHLFEEQVDRTPDRVAVVCGDRAITYQALDKRANQYANYLIQGHGIKPDTLIGVMLDKSDELVAVTLGILKAGGAYVPIDPESPEERMKGIIMDAGIRLLISSKKYVKTLNRLQWETDLQTFLCVDSTDIHQEKEVESNDLMSEEVWRVVGLNATNDIEGGAWVNSYTGEYLGDQDMEEYSLNIYEKLRPYLNENTRLLEIGCASGLSMYRIAPEVGLYVGTDLSEVVIEKNRLRVAEAGMNNIKLACLPAHDIDCIDEKAFDIVIINSVVQCFHGHHYLRDIINKSIGLMKHNGLLFIGDIMDQERKEELIQSMVEFKKNHPNNGYRTKTDWSVELFISQAFLEDLKVDMPAIQEVMFSDKIHTIENELTQFRYDAMLMVDKSVPAALGVRKFSVR